MSRSYWVYILECSDKSYYTGFTNCLERRLWEHNTGYISTCYTFNKRPLTLRYCDHFHDVRAAIAFEKQVKGWSRKKKEALFQEDWNEIVRLANLKPDKSSTSSD